MCLGRILGDFNFFFFLYYHNRVWHVKWETGGNQKKKQSTISYSSTSSKKVKLSKLYKIQMSTIPMLRHPKRITTITTTTSHSNHKKLIHTHTSTQAPPQHTAPLYPSSAYFDKVENDNWRTIALQNLVEVATGHSGIRVSLIHWKQPTTWQQTENSKPGANHSLPTSDSEISVLMEIHKSVPLKPL